MKSSTLKMTIKDGESGVKTYSATINDEWVLMEYELKIITHITLKRLKAGKHNFKLVVYDSVNNATEYQAVFYKIKIKDLTTLFCKNYFISNLFIN